MLSVKAVGIFMVSENDKTLSVSLGAKSPKSLQHETTGNKVISALQYYVHVLPPTLVLSAMLLSVL